MDYLARKARFDEALREREIDLFFCPPSADLEYLTGFPRRIPSFGNSEQAHAWAAGGFFAPGREPILVVLKSQSAFRPTEGVVGDMLEIDNLDDPVALFGEAIRRSGGGSRVGLSARTWASTSVSIQKALPHAELRNGDDVMNGLRRIKSSEEVEAMERAAALADAVMVEIAGRVIEGITELELASEVDYQLRLLGSRTSAFDTGVFAIGRNIVGRDFSTRVSPRRLVAGDAVSFDFGGVVDGYCSDFGRTVYIGEPDEEYVRCHEIVNAAEAAGIAASVPGATAAEVDRATRAVIEDAGYGEWYRHRTGHCVGLDTHERPFLSVEDETPLEVGMVFTIEPSIFWPGRVGVRVENLIVLEEDGCRNLNTFPRDLISSPVRA